MKNFKVTDLFVIFVLMFFIQACKNSPKAKTLSTEDFVNVLNIKNIPVAAIDREAACFFDKGAWFGFALAPDSVKTALGGFSGPFLMNEWRWLSQNLVGLNLEDLQTNTAIDFGNANLQQNSYLPGLLRQQFTVDGLDIINELSFVNDKTALVRLKIKNTTSQTRSLQAAFSGKILWKDAYFKTEDAQVRVGIKDYPAFITISFETGFINGKAEQQKYIQTESAPTELAAGEIKEISYTVTYAENEQDFLEQSASIQKGLFRSNAVFSENNERWQTYLSRILQVNSIWAKDPAYRRIAVKALLTLVNNWKAPLGDLKHAGLIPSYNIHYFNGFWAWDSWKHAVALVNFEPELAKDQVRTMFDYQNAAGMVADCIYTDKRENNLRDTKPPLAAWAVWEIFEVTGDTAFVQEMYPALERYHRWWYAERDYDKNGLCEFGSTDGTAVAARWESGMDNAVRFDAVNMLKSSANAWSMDLESVDLNAYLYKEKLLLANMSALLANGTAAQKYKEEAAQLKKQIRSAFYSEEDGFFYDRKIPSGDFLKVQGPEGWTPLWCEVASKEQAEAVKKVMTDSSRFATFIPFPTVSKQHPQFSKGYWRGPVWLDQVYFGITALQKYGYNKEAEQFIRQIFDRPQGLKNSSAAIRENYNPITGDGMRVRHFSWSAAHLLLLFMGK